MLEELIRGHGHECIFLPKFHCKLNPIEMVSMLLQFILHMLNIAILQSIGGGAHQQTHPHLSRPGQLWAESQDLQNPPARYPTG